MVVSDDRDDFALAGAGDCVWGADKAGPAVPI